MEERVRIRYRALQIGGMVILLAAVRLFENDLFYDPLIQFFKSDYLLDKIPNVNMAKLMINLSIRFGINTLLSLGIIYLAFRDRSIVSFSVLLYGILYVGCVFAFIFLMLNMEREHYLALFYIRRFLIHPLFLLILLPAFYYYRLSRRN